MPVSRRQTTPRNQSAPPQRQPAGARAATPLPRPGTPLSPQQLQQLQRTIGNQAVQRLLTPIPSGVQRISFERRTWKATLWWDNDAAQWTNDFQELEQLFGDIDGDRVPAGKKSALRGQYQTIKSFIEAHRNEHVKADQREKVGKQIGEMLSSVRDLNVKLGRLQQESSQNTAADTASSSGTPQYTGSSQSSQAGQSEQQASQESGKSEQKESPAPEKPRLSTAAQLKLSGLKQMLKGLRQQLKDSEDKSHPDYAELVSQVKEIQDFLARRRDEITADDIDERMAEAQDLNEEIDEATGYKKVSRDRERAVTVSEFEDKGRRNGPVGRKSMFRYLVKHGLIRPGACTEAKPTGQDQKTGSFTAFFSVNNAPDTEIHAHYEQQSSADKVVKSHFKPSSRAGELGHGRNSLSNEQLQDFVVVPFSQFRGPVRRRR